MKIAILTNDYPPNTRGGAGVIAEIQVKELRRRGHDVRAFISIPELQARPSWSRLWFHLRDLAAKKKMVNEILTWKPEILLTHNLTGCGFGTPRAIKYCDIPWVHIIHDVQLVEPSGQVAQGEAFGTFRQIWRWLWSRLRRASFGHPTVVISPTEWLLAFHRRHGFFWSSKTVVIPNPMPDDFRPPSKQDAGREPNILFVGRVDRDKGIDVLMDAWRMMGDDRPRLLVVGDGARRFGLASLHDGKMALYGPQAHPRIVELMHESSVLVVPSLILENQPTVILEGLAAGCRIVASNVGGIPETLNGAGWIVPAGDAKSLHEALREAVDDAGDSAGRAAHRELVLQAHRADVVVGALESILKSNL